MSPPRLRRLAAIASAALVAIMLGGCAAPEASDPDQGDTADELQLAKPLGPDPHGKAARYPIVLVHGFTGSRTLWNFVDVPEALAQDGHRVFHTQLHPFGTPDENAKVLSAQVDEVLRTTGAARVNLVAHSKGGLDARAYISNFKAGDKVASLTTIASPNHGTAIADVALKLLPGSADGALEAISKVWTHHFSTDDLAAGNDIRGALESMAEKNAEAWGRAHPDDARVHYQSWAGVSNVLGIRGPKDEDSCEGKGFMRDAPRDRMDLKLVASALIVGHGTQLLPNDGLSTVESSKHGEFLGCIPADHQDDVGRPGDTGVDSRSGFDHVRFYRQVAFDLAKRGF
ncbi:MAG TPA: alpha/beta fold hydrolase [Labilithrix sp.]|nr:alpha/beta fold hydrolase [Labilithrix sp.]